MTEAAKVVTRPAIAITTIGSTGKTSHIDGRSRRLCDQLAPRSPKLDCARGSGLCHAPGSPRMATDWRTRPGGQPATPLPPLGNRALRSAHGSPAPNEAGSFNLCNHFTVSNQNRWRSPPPTCTRRTRARWVRGEVDNFHPTLQNPLPIYLVNLYCFAERPRANPGPDHRSTLFTQRELGYLREQRSD